MGTWDIAQEMGNRLTEMHCIIPFPVRHPMSPHGTLLAVEIFVDNFSVLCLGVCSGMPACQSVSRRESEE